MGIPRDTYARGDGLRESRSGGEHRGDHGVVRPDARPDRRGTGLRGAQPYGPLQRPLMRILFDQGTPAPLTAFLTGHTVERVRARGWETLANGDLLTAAEAAGFELL